MAKAGLAFSGGGVRSAAFCSGVLRRLLQRETNLDYLSCVSGGGYTGSAYMDWKYRHGKQDSKDWHFKFFNHLRERSGIFCDWQRPIHGVFDCTVLFCLPVFVTLVVPFILWSAYACPLAFAVDYLAGDIIRGGIITHCDSSALLVNETVSECEDRRERKAIERFLLFGAPLVLAFASYFIAPMLPGLKNASSFLTTSFGVIFGLVFLPWFFHDVLEFIPDWMRVLIILPTVVLWFSFPVMRKNATLVVIVYFYAYVIVYRVYKKSFSFYPYTDHFFAQQLWASGLLLWISPLIGTIQQRLGHVYNRWRLQKALFTPTSRGLCGCAGISFRNFFLSCPYFDHKQRVNLDPERPLTLGDLENVKPIFISNAAVNRWRRTTSSTEPDYEALIMSPQGIERLDRPAHERELEGKLMPEDIYLSDAMATSAAAVDHHMGALEGEEMFKDLKVTLGIAMGNSVVSDPRHVRKLNICLQILPYFIEIFRVSPLLISYVFYHNFGGDDYLTFGVFCFFLLLLLLTVIALIPTGSANPSRVERMARYFAVHIPYISYVRKTIGILNLGPSPPPVLRLSDGGHVENLGILPLLRLRLKRIISVYGGCAASEQAFCNTLMNALEMARKKLRCSFTGMDGRDINEDIRINFVERNPGNQPRSYRFKVQYFDKDPEGDGDHMVGEAEVLFIAPRHPNKGIKMTQPMTWKEALSDINENLDEGHWGTGPELHAKEVDRLTFCCCESCHGDACRSFSEGICGAFPQNSTSNQFYTPAMFAAYHREGYRACLEAKATEFLSEQSAQVHIRVENVDETNI